MITTYTFLKITTFFLMSNHSLLELLTEELTGLLTLQDRKDEEDKITFVRNQIRFLKLTKQPWSPLNSCRQQKYFL